MSAFSGRLGLGLTGAYPFGSTAPGAPANLLHGAPGTLADLLHGRPGALANLLHGAPGTLAHVPQRLGGAAADLAHRLAQPPAQFAEDLRVLMERGHHPAKDGGDVVEADLQQRRRLYALDAKRDPPERNVSADVELQQIENLRLQGNPRLKALYLEVDLIDLEHRNVQQHIRLLVG